jgi:hypothetical protein
MEKSNKVQKRNNKIQNTCRTQMIHGHLIQENESTIQVNDKKTHLKGRQWVKQRKLGP